VPAAARPDSAWPEDAAVEQALRRAGRTGTDGLAAAEAKECSAGWARRAVRARTQARTQLGLTAPGIVPDSSSGRYSFWSVAPIRPA